MSPLKFHGQILGNSCIRVEIINIPLMQINNCHNNCNKYIICNGGIRRVGYATYIDNNNIVMITHSIILYNDSYIDPTPCQYGYNYRYFIDLASSIEELNKIMLKSE